MWDYPKHFGFSVDTPTSTHPPRYVYLLLLQWTPAILPLFLLLFASVCQMPSLPTPMAIVHIHCHHCHMLCCSASVAPCPVSHQQVLLMPTPMPSSSRGAHQPLPSPTSPPTSPCALLFLTSSPPPHHCTCNGVRTCGSCSTYHQHLLHSLLKPSPVPAG